MRIVLTYGELYLLTGGAFGNDVTVLARGIVRKRGWHLTEISVCTVGTCTAFVAHPDDINDNDKLRYELYLHQPEELHGWVQYLVANRDQAIKHLIHWFRRTPNEHWYRSSARPFMVRYREDKTPVNGVVVREVTHADYLG